MHITKGSVLLLLMIIISSAFLLSLATWRVTSYMIDVIAHKTHHMYQTNALNTLQEYAYACLQEYKKELVGYVQEHKKGVIAFDHWPKNDSSYRATIEFIQGNDNNMQLLCTVAGEYQAPLKSSCQVVLRDSEVEICQWRYEG